MAKLDKINIDGVLYDIEDAGAYRKPQGGIPSSDLEGDIPKSKLDSSVQSSLSNADAAAAQIFDISAYYATGGVLTKYADLAAALDSNNGGGVPQSLQKGGMSVKFVQSSDNKYVQYSYMDTSTAAADFTNTANWQGVDDEPTAGSDNLVKSGGVAEKFDKLEGTDEVVIVLDEEDTGYIKWDDGNIGQNDSYLHSTDINVKEGDKFTYKIIGCSTVGCFIGAYGENGYIQSKSIRGTGDNETVQGEYVVDSEVKILRFCCRSIYRNYFNVKKLATAGIIGELEGRLNDVESSISSITDNVEDCQNDIAALDLSIESLNDTVNGSEGKEPYDVILTDEDEHAYVNYNTGNVVASDTSRAKKIIVSVGDKFSYRDILALDSLAPIAAFDMSDNYIQNKSLQGAGNNTSLTGTYEVEDANIAYIIVNIQTSRLSYFQMHYEGSAGRDSLQEQIDAVNDRIDNIGSIDPMVGISLSDLSKAGSGTDNPDGTITLATGYNNRLYWDCPTVATCYTMAAKFKCASGTPSFSIGKDQYGDARYGGHITLEGNKLLFFRNSNEDGTYTHQEFNLGFTLVTNKFYSVWVHRYIDYETGTRGFNVSVYGELNEVYKVDLSYGPWLGKPYIASDNAACTVYNYNFSMQYDFDIRNSKVGVWGHSYVEADSLQDTDKLKSFTNLIGNVLGHDRVFNFGLGGEYAQRLLSRIPGECLFASQIRYALIIIGANDTVYNIDTITGYLDSIAKYFIEKNITPILMTSPPMPAKPADANAWLIQLNAWIRNSGYLYTDTYQVFVDGNGDVRTDLYLPDNTHPTVAGHQLIFDRIKMDCPYLF